MSTAKWWWKQVTDGLRAAGRSLRQPDRVVKRAGDKVLQTLKKYAKFVGPGFMVSTWHRLPGYGLS